MKILLYFTIAVPDPSVKTLTTGVQRSDFIAKLTEDYRLDLFMQHMNNSSPSSLDGKWFKWNFNDTHECVLHLQSPQCWNHNYVNTYDTKISVKTHLKRTEKKG